jgi:hypothetical protein
MRRPDRPLFDPASLPPGALFAVGEEPYSVADALFMAERRGALDAALARLAAAGPAADPAAAIARWRKERGLFAAVDAEGWLAARGLASRDLAAFAARRPGAPADERALYAALALSGALDRFALDLARRAAVHAAWKAGGRARPPEGEVRGRLAAEADLAPAAARIAFEDALYELFGRGLLAGRGRLALERWRLDLVRVDLLDAAFPARDAAEEALLCARDGEPLEDVARRAGASAARESGFVEDLAPAARALVLSAAPGAHGGPLALGGAHHVYRVDAKHAPALGDPAVEARLAARLAAEAADAEVAARVRFLAWVPWLPSPA